MFHHWRSETPIDATKRSTGRYGVYLKVRNRQGTETWFSVNTFQAFGAQDDAVAVEFRYPIYDEDEIADLESRAKELR